MFQADELLLALREAHVRFVVIGGIAVGVHGYVRATKDLDIVPDPEPENVTRLSSLLRELDAEHVGVGDFAAEEFPYDPIDPEQLALGANFRLETRLGPLDIMQWVAGIDESASLTHQPLLLLAGTAVATMGEVIRKARPRRAARRATSWPVRSRGWCRRRGR